MKFQLLEIMFYFIYHTRRLKNKTRAHLNPDILNLRKGLFPILSASQWRTIGGGGGKVGKSPHPRGQKKYSKRREKGEEK